MKRELLELEKISNSPQQIQKLLNSGLLMDKVNLGRVHTQIIIDAEQSLTENVIKVNSINKKFLGFEKFEQDFADPERDREETKDLKEDPHLKSQFKQQNIKAPQKRESEGNYHKEQQSARQTNQYAISEQDYKHAQSQSHKYLQQKHQTQLSNSQNPNSDPLGILLLQNQLKKDTDYLSHINYRPPQTINIFGNQRYYKSGYGIAQKNRTLDLRTKDSKSYNSSRKRSKYKMLNPDIKYKAVQMAKDKGAKQSAHHYGVPLKSLKRWMKVGWQRKKGGGRKTKDPEMEKRLYQWYQSMKDSGNSVTAKMIKDKAIQLRSCGDFIASKGWLDKFKIRYRLEISKESGAGSIHGGVNCPIMGQIGVTSYHSSNSNSSYNLSSNLESQSNR